MVILCHYMTIMLEFKYWISQKHSIAVNFIAIETKCLELRLYTQLF